MKILIHGKENELLRNYHKEILQLSFFTIKHCDKILSMVKDGKKSLNATFRLNLSHYQAMKIKANSNV